MTISHEVTEKHQAQIPRDQHSGKRLQLLASNVNRLFQLKKTAWFNLRFVILAMMLTVSVVPILAFYKWVERSSFEKEVAYVDENHLIIAKNLSAALSRYAVDLKSTFNLVVQNEINDVHIEGLATILASFNICHISIFDAQNQVTGVISGKSPHSEEQPDESTLAYLRQLARDAKGEVAISGIRNHNGTPHFFAVQMLAGDELAIAPWDPAYINEMQKSIAFGELGHSMVVDQYGVVVAHPNAEWQRISKDASKLSVVQAMISGQTGVMQFYSPPMKADMIAGYTFVPETGWGVMVPQPISELAARAADVQSAALIIAAVEIFLAVLISLWLSSLIAKPIQKIVNSARKLAGGDFDAHVGELSKRAPSELRLLASTFDRMVDELSYTTAKLNRTLLRSEDVAQERAELLIAAKQASEVKSRFVSMVSHELRTPLTSIKGALELLDGGLVGELPTQGKELIRIATKNSKRLATMINDLLDLDKLDDGGMQYENAPVEMAHLVRESIEANNSFGALNEVTFQAITPNDDVMIYGDHNRLMQVMANLLSNAAKFSSSGSNVEVTLTSTDTNAMISVQDHGIGISEKDQSRVFERFVQLESNDARRFGGSGLGLGIAKVIVEKHRGTIGFSSEEGKGTTFHFELPLLVGEDEK